jgi:hypothetical protein
VSVELQKVSVELQNLDKDVIKVYDVGSERQSMPAKERKKV